MRWMVNGVDSKSGKEVKLNFEAHDAKEAENLAAYNGVLVSAVTPMNGAKKDASANGKKDDPLTMDAPGKYHVVGTDWTTGMKTSWYIHAQSRHAAQVMAENEGIVITKLEYVLNEKSANEGP